MERFVEVTWKCLESYGLNRLPEQDRRRLAEIAYTYREEVRVITEEQRFEITYQSLRKEEEVIRKIAKDIHEFFPELRYYKKAAQEVYRQLFANCFIQRIRDDVGLDETLDYFKARI